MNHRITMSYLRSWSTYQSFSQAYFIITLWRTINVHWFLTNINIPLKASDTFLEATAPVKLTIWYCLFSKNKLFHSTYQGISRMLHSLVFYTIYHKRQYQNTVKLHRVFASSGRQTASARLIQFHWEASGDSRAALPHSCRTTFNGQGISLLSDPYS